MVRANMQKYNSSNVGSFKTPQPGIYLIKVIDGEVNTSKNGNEYWRMTYEIKEQGNEFYGQWLFDNIIFTPKTMDRAKLIFEAFNLNMPDSDEEYTAADLLGCIAKVQVSHWEKYIDKEGKERNKAVIAFDGYYKATESEQDIAEEIPF